MNPAFKSFVAPARPRAQLWRLLLGAVIVLFVYAGFAAAIFAGLALVTDAPGLTGWIPDMIEVESPWRTLTLLATFPGMMIGVFATARLLHKRPAASLFGPRGRVLRDFTVCFAIATVLFALASLFVPGDVPLPNLPFSVWLGFLPLTMLALLMQTGAEEVLFRGYLQQQLAARFGSPVAWLIFPSLVFGLAHFDPEAKTNIWPIVAAMGVFGFAAADLTARTGSIGAGWGLHLANNLHAVALVSLPGPLSGLALYMTPYGADAPAQLRHDILIGTALILLSWFLCRLAIARLNRPRG